MSMSYKLVDLNKSNTARISITYNESDSISLVNMQLTLKTRTVKQQLFIHYISILQQFTLLLIRNNKNIPRKL